MGFLSRKTKSKPAPTVEEPHPIVEELQAMEDAVHERNRDDEGPRPQAAGPVTAGDPPSPSVAKASSGTVPSTAPPAGGDSEVEAEDSEPARFMPRDLIAPSRHDAVVEEPVAEAPTKHAEVIAFANQKGGVAKTTTTLNLAVAFAESGHRVLAVDLDPQGNLTMSQGINPDSLELSMYDVLVHKTSIREVIRRREVDIACASIDLAGAEIAMSTMIGRERALEKAFAPIQDDYDFICIDTPPSLGLLT